MSLITAPVPPSLTLIRNSRRELARLLTRVENGAANTALAALYPYTGSAHVIGITGAPGTGKSTLVSALAKHYRQHGQTVGIIAVDPTSPFTGGAILGDRIRMGDLAGDAGIFIRSMATRGNLGGLARTAADMVRVLDAAGFPIILIETVGAGQSEVDIAHTAHTTLVVEAPGLGDDVQAIKAGILEIADILVVNKADRVGADNTIRALRAMLDLGHKAERLAHHGSLSVFQTQPVSDSSLEATTPIWTPPVLPTVASTGEGIATLAEKIAAHRDHLTATGLLAQRERSRLESEIITRLGETLLTEKLRELGATRVADLVDRVVARTIAPADGVMELLDDDAKPK